MRKKSIIVWMATAFFMSIAIVVSVSFACDDLGPEELVLNVEGKRPAVLNHKSHQDRMSCTSCHHSDLLAGLCEDLRCDNCHYIDNGLSNGKKDNVSYPNEDLDTWKEIGHV